MERAGWEADSGHPMAAFKLSFNVCGADHWKLLRVESLRWSLSAGARLQVLKMLSLASFVYWSFGWRSLFDVEVDVLRMGWSDDRDP